MVQQGDRTIVEKFKFTNSSKKTNSRPMTARVYGKAINRSVTKKSLSVCHNSDQFANSPL